MTRLSPTDRLMLGAILFGAAVLVGDCFLCVTRITKCEARPCRAPLVAHDVRGLCLCVEVPVTPP